MNTSKPQWQYWVYSSLSGIVLGFLICFILLQQCNKPVKPSVVYKTDTIVKRITDTLKVEPGLPVKPKTITVYVPIFEGNPEKHHDSLWTAVEPYYTGDSVYIVEIDTSLETRRPMSPTVLGSTHSLGYSDFKYRDKFGQLRVNTYPTDLFNNTYQMYLGLDGELHFDSYPIKRPINPPVNSLSSKWKTSSYTYLGYSPFYRGATLSLDFSVERGKFGLYTRGAISTYKNYLNAEVGLKYKLK